MKISVAKPATELFNRFSDLSVLQGALVGLSADVRAKVGDVQFTSESIKINTPQVGAIEFVVKERVEPTKVVFGTLQSPVPLTMELDIEPNGDNASQIQTVIDVEIPAMLKPFVGPQLQKATDKFGELIQGLSR